MQHLVKHDVLHHKPRHAWMIKDPTDDNGIVRRIIVSKAVAGVGAAPGELGASHEAVEEAAVQVFKISSRWK